MAKKDAPRKFVVPTISAEQITLLLTEGNFTPRFTPIPDVWLDKIMPALSNSELRVCLYIMRKTYGWGKSSDAISIRQMVEGLVGADGERVDWGTGLSTSGVMLGVKGLEERGIIQVSRVRDERGNTDINVYSLCIPHYVVSTPTSRRGVGCSLDSALTPPHDVGTQERTSTTTPLEEDVVDLFASNDVEERQQQRSTSKTPTTEGRYPRDPVRLCIQKAYEAFGLDGIATDPKSAKRKRYPRLVELVHERGVPQAQEWAQFLLDHHQDVPEGADPWAYFCGEFTKAMSMWPDFRKVLQKEQSTRPYTRPPLETEKEEWLTDPNGSGQLPTYDENGKMIDPGYAHKGFLAPDDPRRNGYTGVLKQP